MKRLYLIFALFSLSIFLVVSCEHTPTGSSSGTEYIPNYPEEAATMALVESRQFRPPAELVEQIDRELTLIRDQWGDSIPEVLLPYNDPWMGRLGIFAGLDSIVLLDTLSPEREALDSAMAHLGAHLTSYSVFYPGIQPDIAIIYPEKPWYPPAAVDSLAGLPGIQFLMTEYVASSEFFHTHVRRTSGSSSTWYFGSDCNWTTRTFVFDVRGRRSDFVNEYHYCFPNIDSAAAAWTAAGIPIHEQRDIVDAYTKQAYEKMPDWFRSVQLEIYEGFFAGGHMRLWERGKP